MSDAELQNKLGDKLRYDRIGFGIMFNSLALRVQGGAVTVRDEPQPRLRLWRTQPEVQDVIDEINVLPTSGFDDELRTRIGCAIYDNPALQRNAIDPEKPIRIIVENVQVTLQGVVNGQFDKQLAGVLANSVPNVFSVTNNLMVPGKS